MLDSSSSLTRRVCSGASWLLWVALTATLGCGAAPARNGSHTEESDGLADARRATVRGGARSPDASCAELVRGGLSHLAAERLEDAARAFETATRAHPGCAVAWLDLAIVERRRGGLGDALRHVRRALAVDPDGVHGFHQLVLVHLAQAEEDVGALELADLACRQGLQLDEGFAPLHSDCGVVDVQRGRIVEGLARFERAFELDPEHFEAWMNFGQITLSFRGFEDAERAFRAALDLRPDDYDALLGLGIALRGRGQAEEARRSYERALAVAPERPEAWYDLGILHQDHLEGSHDGLAQARAYLEAFVDKAEGNPELADEVAEVLRCCPADLRAGTGEPCRPGRLQTLRRALAAEGTTSGGSEC